MKKRSVPAAPVGVLAAPGPVSMPPAEPFPPGGESLLSGCVPLPNQVAGHRFGVHKVGIFQHPDGTILKQLKPGGGRQEMTFYSTVYAQDCRDPRLLELRQHLPRYYGACWSPSSPADLYLKLEDVTRRFARPCIMDVKLGRQTYDQFASQEKREHRIGKYPLMKEMGFVVLGMRVYEATSDSFRLYDKSYGRALTKDTVRDGLARFFRDPGGSLRRDAVLASIRKVRRILRWFESQRQLVFYASSLLFVYEGVRSSSSSPSSVSSSSEDDEPPWKRDATGAASGNAVRSGGEGEGEGGEVEVERRAGLWGEALSQRPIMEDGEEELEGTGGGEEDVEVRMIDFAHTFTSDSHDHGYTYGLKQLLAVLEQILHASSHPLPPLSSHNSQEAAY